MSEEGNVPRCLFIIPRLTVGGAERVMITLFNHWPYPMKQLLAAGRTNGMEDYVGSGGAVRVIGASRLVFAVPAIIRAVWRYRPDVIISSIAHMNTLMLALKSVLPRGTRLIVREANMPANVLDKEGWKKRVLLLGYRHLYNRADLVVVQSRLMREALAPYARGKPMRIAQLFNPVDVDFIRARAREGWEDANARHAGKMRFVAAGRLVPAKGFDRLLERLKNLPAGMDWHLDILGEGAERPRLEAIVAREGLAERVALSGVTDNPWPVMAAADVFLLSSRWEGMPNVALEALALGTPVIAMREAGGIGEVAELAADGAVRIVDTIDGFIAAAGETVRGPRGAMRESLLPEEFTLPVVMREFGRIIRDVAASKRAG